jgi:hypothetical protein
MGRHFTRWWRSGWREPLRPFVALIVVLLACVSATITFSMVPIPYGGLVHEAECLILPLVRGAADAPRNVSTDCSNNQTWRQAVNDNLALSALLILGIVLHAALAGIHINEKLRGHLQKHPAIRKGMVAGGTLLIAAGAIPQVGNLLGGVTIT